MIWTHPEGGLFTWVELDSEMDIRELLEECLENNVAFVPGGSFFPNGERNNTMRLNYSNMPEDRIAKGIQVMGRIIRQRQMVQTVITRSGLTGSGLQ